MYHLAKYDKEWEHIKTGKKYGDKLELKDGERIMDYKQVAKAKKQPQATKLKKQEKQEKQPYSFMDAENKKDDKGVF